MKVQEAVRRETGRVALHVVFMTLVMLAVFFALHLAFPKKIGFSYGTVFSALPGAAVGILNFFLMGLTVQHVAGLEDPKEAKRFMQKSYVNRNTMQIVWMILAVAVPVIHPVRVFYRCFSRGFPCGCKASSRRRKSRKPNKGVRSKL